MAQLIFASFHSALHLSLVYASLEVQVLVKVSFYRIKKHQVAEVPKLVSSTPCSDFL